MGVKNGEHRRNVVARGVSLKALRRGERFRVGEVVFDYRVCARVIENGTVRVADEIEVQ